MKTLTEAIYAIALTLWIGGLWAIGYIVAPTLFYTLADRTLAGMLAGKLFMLIAYVGIGCAVYLLLFRLVRFGGACFRHGIFWIVLALLLLTLAGEFGVQRGADFREDAVARRMLGRHHADLDQFVAGKVAVNFVHYRGSQAGVAHHDDGIECMSAGAQRAALG